MIEIPRTLARRFRAVVRKSVMAADPRGPCPLVLIQAGKNGLVFWCSQGEVSVRHHSPGRRNSDRLALPVSAFAALEGRESGVVTLEGTDPFKVRARWLENGTARSEEFDTAEPASTPGPPQPASNAVEMSPIVLNALAEATRTTSRQVGRFSLARVLLRGADSSVIATDGRQLLIQTGFGFPWRDSQLIPSLPVFDLRELHTGQPVKIGLTGEQVTLEVGPWLLCMKSEPATRYPNVNAVIPHAKSVLTRLRIGREDAESLIRALPSLPGAGEPNSPVTLDLLDRIAVCARGKEEPAGEIVLERSRCEGTPMRLVFDRRYLVRALRLGFDEVQLSGSDRPLLCRDPTRTFVWMPLSSEPAVVPADSKDTESQPNTESPRKEPAMPANNGRPAEPGHQELPDPLTEAEALRVHLQEALVCAGRLVVALKQERRRTRVVQAAVASLKRLDS